jgi:hypothetical protein
MAITIEQKPVLVRNGIVQQLKQAANSLTIQEWNQVVNTLKTQANITVEYLEKLHRVMFGSWTSDTADVHELFDNGVVFHLLNQIATIRVGSRVTLSFTAPVDDVLNDIWLDLGEQVIVYTVVLGGDFTTGLFNNVLSGGTFNETPIDIVMGGNFNGN